MVSHSRPRCIVGRRKQEHKKHKRRKRLTSAPAPLVLLVFLPLLSLGAPPPSLSWTPLSWAFERERPWLPCGNSREPAPARLPLDAASGRARRRSPTARSSKSTTRVRTHRQRASSS